MTHTDHALTHIVDRSNGGLCALYHSHHLHTVDDTVSGVFISKPLQEKAMTIQQFANEEFDEQKVERHEVRQVLRNVRKFTPEDWVEARRQRAAAQTEQTNSEAAQTTPGVAQ